MDGGRLMPTFFMLLREILESEMQSMLINKIYKF